MKRFLRRARTSIGRLTGRVPRLEVDLRIESMRLGTEYGGWVIAPSALPRRGVVYSAGVGADVSFDSALLRGFEPSVLHLIDPTPGVLEHPRVSSLSSDTCRITRVPVALSGTSGTLRLWPPKREDHVSYSGVHITERTPIEVPAQTLSELVEGFEDERVDLLKMDIEGAEYDVIDELLDGTIRPGHLLVEFHHRFPGFGPDRTEESVGRLRKAGFRLFSISPTGEEYSFLHETALENFPR